MSMNYNEQLQHLLAEISQKKNLEMKRNELLSQRTNLESHIQELQKNMWKEEADVDCLERTGLTSVFYALVGKKEDMLDKEKSKHMRPELNMILLFRNGVSWTMISDILK